MAFAGMAELLQEGAVAFAGMAEQLQQQREKQARKWW